MSGCETVTYLLFWLRDNCRCENCYNNQTFQRKHDILEIPEDVKPQTLKIEDNQMIIIWEDAHRSEYSANFLWECWPTTWMNRNATKRVLWSGMEVANNVAFVKRDDFLKSKDTLREFLQSLVTYGVAFVDDVEPTIEDTELMIRRVGPVQYTLFGGMWSFTSNMARADTAYTTIPLGPHTDNTYFTEAAGLQVLHCMEHTGTGGDTLLLDGFRWADEMRRDDPKSFEILSTTFQPAEYLEDGYFHKFSAPVIVLNPINDELQQIRFNVYDRSPHSVKSGDEARNYYKALKALARRYNSPQVQWRFKLNPGRMVFFDNWRVLHGRDGFTGKRVLGGAYVSRGDWLSAARIHGVIN